MMIKAAVKRKVLNVWHECHNPDFCCRLTVCPEDESRGRAVNFSLCDAVRHHTSVVAHIRRLDLGNIEVSRLLGDEPPIVLLNKVWVLIENPCISEVWKTHKGADYS